MIALLFLLLVAYQLKHFLADYIFQGEYQLGKFKPGWEFLGPLVSHVLFHFFGTVAIVAGTLYYFDKPAPLGFAVILGLFDATVHFFMDRIKAGPRYMGRWKAITAGQYMEHKKTLAAKVGDQYWEPTFDQWCEYDEYLLKADQRDARKALRGNRLFWWCLGFDQMVHHLTHYVCILVLLGLVVLL